MVTVKKDKLGNYVRLDESKFIADVDAMIDKSEKAAKLKYVDATDVQYCEETTRLFVKEVNDRYKSHVHIKYRGYSRPKVRAEKNKPGVRINPGPLVNPQIVPEDKYVAGALNELRGVDYDWVHYGGDEYAHTMYVYWWLKHHIAPTNQYSSGRLFKLEPQGLEKETRVKLRDYLNTPIEGSWNYYDVVMLLALYHDIGKKRQKETGVDHWTAGADMWRDEIAAEIGVPESIKETIGSVSYTHLTLPTNREV